MFIAVKYYAADIVQRLLLIVYYKTYLSVCQYRHKADTYNLYKKILKNFHILYIIDLLTFFFKYCNIIIAQYMEWKRDFPHIVCEKRQPKILCRSY